MIRTDPTFARTYRPFQPETAAALKAMLTRLPAADRRGPGPLDPGTVLEPSGASTWSSLDAFGINDD